MKETDYDSATPSLEQEMNLARRACWCNNNNNNNKSKTNNDNDNKNYCNNDADNALINDAVVEDDDDDEGYDGLDDDVNDETTFLKNGATFSKNILIVKNIDNVDNIENSHLTNIEKTIPTISTKTNNNTTIITTITTTNNVNNTTTANISENNLIRRLLKITTTIKPSSKNSRSDTRNNKNFYENDNNDDNDVVDEKNDGFRSAAKGERIEFLTLVKTKLLYFWLIFVAFCDSVTIKPDDPRFQNARQAEQERKQQQQQQQQQKQKSSQQEQKQKQQNANSSGDNPTTKTTTSTKKTGKFKLLCSKKLLFLFFVCVFFSCLNYIEARPNTIVPPNAISDGGGGDTSASVASNAVNSAKTEKLMVASSSTDSVSSAPPLPKASGQNADAQIEAREDPTDDTKHHINRYPLAQVDFDRVKTPFIIGMWILCASIAKIGFHMTPKLHLIFPESCLLVVVGVLIGVVLFFCTEVAVSPLTPNTFFFYMLPPIILDAGYFMPNRLFFDNLGTILLMAVIGTVFNTAMIGGSLYVCGLAGIFGSEEYTPKLLDTFLFASLISAVDPVAVLAVFEEIHVNEILYIVVFGESLLNDAVTVVLYHMMESFNEMGLSNIITQDCIYGIGSFFVIALGGTIIGIIWGFLTGLVTRFTDHVRVIEPIFIFVMAYLAYLNAEIFHMSGILAITFCGITMKNYVESNISIKSHTTVKYALKMLSSSSETIIFMFLGVATVNNDHVWNTLYVVLTIVFCSVYRIIGIIILTGIANRFRLHKLSRVDQFVMSYGGLRGAVAFALVLLIDESVVKQKDMFVTTTIAVIYFTVFVQGITIKPLVKFLNVKRANKRKPTMNERIHERFMDHLMAGIEDIVGKTGNYNVRDKFKRFDNRYIRPLLIRDLQGAEPKIIETYSKLTMRDAMEVMRRNPSTIGQISGTESMSALFRNYTNNCIGGRWDPPTIYTTCPSLTNLDNNISRNLDMHELDYNPSKKDLTDAKIHHLLAEELKPYRRHRRLSYSRHAVDDRDLSTRVNYKMQMNFRRMFNDRKHHKRSKRAGSKQQEGVKQNHVSFHDFQQNGTSKQLTHDYINEVLNESAEETPSKLTDITVVNSNDEWDEDGLTFTAKSSPDSDRENNNSLIAHIQNLPGFDASKARIVKTYAPATTPSTITSLGDYSPEKMLTPDNGPTAAELILPWRRDRSYQSFVAENAIPEEDRNFSRDSDGGERRVATPTATESQLPWKRHEDENVDAVQQNEFPAWASNKEYLAYNSPSATFLGGINKPKQPKSVIGLFRRESSSSKGGSSGVVAVVGIGSDAAVDSNSARGSDPTLAAALNSMTQVVPSSSSSSSNPRLDKRSQSLVTPPMSLGEGHAGQFPVTASHRRNVRRGSMLELTGDVIPEETYQHGQSKSLCEPAGDDWNATPTLNAKKSSQMKANSLGGGGGGDASGREPLLPRLSPRAQIRKMGIGGGGVKSHVTTALLSTSSNSEYDEDDDEGEDFELYDDENIVVTTTTIPNPAAAAAFGSGNNNSRNRQAASESGNAAAAATPPPPPTTTTTTIRLTRNNDESII